MRSTYNAFMASGNRILGPTKGLAARVDYIVAGLLG